MGTLLSPQNTKRYTPNPSSLHIPHILSVDDDTDFQTSLKLRLQKYEIDITPVYYGMQGIRETARLLPDLILLDQAMPLGTGDYMLEVIKRNKSTCHIPVLVLTGMRNPIIKTNLLNSGAERVLQKPIHFEALLQHISRYIDIRERFSMMEQQ